MFLAFLCVSDHFESIETHFFFENFREREARNVRERNNREYEHEAQSAEGAKRPSSPAGLAWRGTKWLAGLVLYEISPFVTPPRNRGGVIFSLQFVCVCVCVQLCLWTKFQPNGCTDLDSVFTKRLLSTLALTLLKLVTLGQRSRSQWLNIHFFWIFFVNFPTVYLSSRMFDQTEI